MRVMNYAKVEYESNGIHFYNKNGVVCSFDCSGRIASVRLNENGYYQKNENFEYSYFEGDSVEPAKVAIQKIKAFVAPVIDNFRKAKALNFKKNDVFIYKKEIYIPYEMCPVAYLGEKEIVPFSGYKKVTRHLYNLDCYVLAELKLTDTTTTDKIIRLHNSLIMSGCYVTMVDSDERQYAETLAEAFNELNHTTVFNCYNVANILKKYNITEK